MPGGAAVGAASLAAPDHRIDRGGRRGIPVLLPILLAWLGITGIIYLAWRLILLLTP